MILQTFIRVKILQHTIAVDDINQKHRIVKIMGVVTPLCFYAIVIPSRTSVLCDWANLCTVNKGRTWPIASFLSTYARVTVSGTRDPAAGFLYWCRYKINVRH